MLLKLATKTVNTRTSQDCLPIVTLFSIILKSHYGLRWHDQGLLRQMQTTVNSLSWLFPHKQFKRCSHYCLWVSVDSWLSLIRLTHWLRFLNLIRMKCLHMLERRWGMYNVDRLFMSRQWRQIEGGWGRSRVHLQVATPPGLDRRQGFPWCKFPITMLGPGPFLSERGDYMEWRNPRTPMRTKAITDEIFQQENSGLGCFVAGELEFTLGSFHLATPPISFNNILSNENGSVVDISRLKIRACFSRPLSVTESSNVPSVCRGLAHYRQHGDVLHDYQTKGDLNKNERS